MATNGNGRHTGLTISRSQIHKLKEGLKQKAEDIVEDLVYRLSAIALECINTARTQGNYGTVTGNLRSSIGAIVMADGREVFSGIADRTAGPKGNGDAGRSEAETAIDFYRGELREGVWLVVFAGMEYAVYVQEVHGLDVIASASLVMDELMRKMAGDLIE